MKALLGVGMIAVATACGVCGAACGGNVVVDDGTTTTGSSSTSSGTTSSGTLPACHQTCLEAIKSGGGVCTGGQGLAAFNDFAGCADLNCPSVCVDLGASGASAGCLDCMAQACMNQVMVCTAS